MQAGLSGDRYITATSMRSFYLQSFDCGINLGNAFSIVNTEYMSILIYAHKYKEKEECLFQSNIKYL
jgi:hypothetical protein